MRGPCAAEAEVIGGGHQASAKVLLPEPIDQHARGPRIVARDDPLRECQSSAAALVRLAALNARGTRVEQREEPRLNDLAR